jgi:hypothetical protein
MKIHPLGAEVFHADGRTDSRVEASSRFSQFFEGAKKLNGVTINGWRVKVITLVNTQYNDVCIRSVPRMIF